MGPDISDDLDDVEKHSGPLVIIVLDSDTEVQIIDISAETSSEHDAENEATFWWMIWSVLIVTLLVALLIFLMIGRLLVYGAI